MFRSKRANSFIPILILIVLVSGVLETHSYIFFINYINPQIKHPQTFENKNFSNNVAVTPTKEPVEQHVVDGQIKFSDYTWNLENSGENRWAPNNNLWSENAWVDKSGYLHLQIRQSLNEEWTSVSASLNENVGYGHYKLTLDNQNDNILKIDKNTVFGFFTFSDLNEVDMIEISRWSQNKVPIGNIETAIHANHNVDFGQFILLPGQSELVFEMNWTPDYIEVSGPQTKNGQNYYYKYSGQINPLIHKTKLIMNFWQHNHDGINTQGLAPSNGEPQEMIVKSFSFSPIK